MSIRVRPKILPGRGSKLRQQLIRHYFMICIYFKEEKCSIYEDRPSCCRNFPNRSEGMFCSKTKCVYDKDNNLDCANCTDKCCRHLEMDIFDIKLLDISCSECKEKYCFKESIQQH